MCVMAGAGTPNKVNKGGKTHRQKHPGLAYSMAAKRKKKISSRRHSLTLTGTIVPDYRSPSAVMVPHYPCEITPLLEEIAIQVARDCGVILLSNNKAFSQAFIASQKYPENFTLVTAPLDTPWIRDRSPVAIKTPGGIRWCIPRAGIATRKNDNRLFARICAKPQESSPIDFLPQGNMVAGANGLVFVSRDVLKDNDLSVADLDEYAKPLGVRCWLVFPGFRRERTGHADIYVRVLKPRLIAVSWNLSSKADRQTASRLIKQIKRYNAGITTIKIPIRSQGDHYASLINWVQLGKRLLVPRYPMTEASDIKQTTKLLNQHGFSITYIYSPTLDYNGSLHCLTASIYV